MARMIPPTIDPDVKSPAERRIFEWFERLEWKNAVVLHSLGIAQHSKNIFGEIDFVIISNEGILCVEVKGGQVYREDGIWYFKNRYGEVNSKHVGPFEQAQGNMHSLMNHIKNRLTPSNSISKCQFACCVMTPDCQIKDNGVDIISDVLFDGLCKESDLVSFLDKSMMYWRNQCEEKHGFQGGKLSLNDINDAATLLRGDFKFVPSLSVTLERVEEQLLRVTDEQYEIMEGFDESERLLISGAAGTGKTLLALEQCRRLGAAGKKVLFLCYNKLIAQYITDIKNKENGNYFVSSLHHLMMDLTGECISDDYGEEYYRNILPSRLISMYDNGEVEEKYDAIIIDEGQDLMNSSYYLAINCLIKGGFSEGIWTIFFDPSQNIFNADEDFNDVWKQLKQDADNTYKLTINCRNTRQIAVANKMISNIPTAKKLRAEGNEVEYIMYDSKDEEFNNILRIIRNLRSQGISSKDIVILSKKEKDSCMYNRSIPKDISPIIFNTRTSFFDRAGTCFYTIQAFKGLESKVVILCDVDNFKDDQSRLLNYVAVSRARTLLYVLYDRAVDEQRKEMLIKGALMK